MSEEQTQETSSEDKFFGVKTQIGKKSEPAPVEEASDIEVRVVDDTPPEDRNRPTFSDDTPADDGITEDELKSYTGSAQKRINSCGRLTTMIAGSESKLRRCAMRLFV